MPTLSTHILDTSTGAPASGVRVEVRDATGGLVASGETDGDGRIKDWEAVLRPGVYTAIFHTADYFQANGQTGFWPKVSVEFDVTDERHYHVPLLLSPYGYSTYRGS